MAGTRFSFDNKPPKTALDYRFTKTERPRDFLSLRWRFTLPVLFVVAIIAMIATYVISDSAARGIRDTQINQLLTAAKTTNERTAQLGTTLRRELDRVIYTANVPNLVRAKNSTTLEALVQPLAAAGDLDYVIISDSDGQELVGISRDSNTATYQASQKSVLSRIGFIEPLLSAKENQAYTFVRTSSGYALFSGSAIRNKENEIVGIAIVGINLKHVLESINSSSLDPVTVYDVNGQLLRTTIDADESILNTLAIDTTVRNMTLAADNRVPIRSIQIGSTPYQAAYIPFEFDSTLLGVIGIFQANNAWYATDASRQWLNLFLSMIVGASVLLVYLAMSVILRRLNLITDAVQALAAGDPYARTNLVPDDELGELGRAVDLYANRVQKRQDWLEQSLKNQRRETIRLTAVLAAIPEGIIVQDLDGRVVLMNDRAIKLIGSQQIFRNSPLNELTAAVTDKLGAALAPGIYTLGDPQRVEFDGKIIHAQAAAVLSFTEKQIGTVIVLRDITDEVRREQSREAALEKLAVQSAASMFPQPSRTKVDDPLQLFIHEVNRNAITLQRMITEIRELSTTDANSLQAIGQQALSAETLIWNVAREWQSAARSAQIDLHVMVLRRNLFVLGEERRLRWAVGNLLDNAVKYTPAHGHVTLMLKATDDDQSAQISITDNGYGISMIDLPSIFTRFYRGKPTAKDGQVIQTPGTGQGLFIARRIIEAHGGSIELTSTVGEGTEVVFTLPLTSQVTMDVSETTSRIEQQEVLSRGQDRRL